MTINYSLSESRLAHSLAVANKMRQLAIEDGSFSKEEIDDMWLLGYLHDIGYAYGEPKGHAARGGMILKQSNYKHWLAVYNHGLGDTNIQYRELALLNIADLTTNSKGIDVSCTDRVEQIKNNYGEDSNNYKNAIILSNYLFENDKINYTNAGLCLQ